MIFFYNKTSGNIYSYINTLIYNKTQCSTNNSTSVGDIGIAEFLVENPTTEDFKDNINDLDSGDYSIIE